MDIKIDLAVLGVITDPLIVFVVVVVVTLSSKIRVKQLKDVEK